MLNLLVAVDRSLEASFALRTACFLGHQITVRPIYVFDPPGRDISLGAGWAWKSWERDIRRQAQRDIAALVQAERNLCANIEDPVIVMGDPVQEMAAHFWKGGFDLLVVGVPLKELDLLALSRRFRQMARKARQGLPLLLVKHLKSISTVVALTDGRAAAENALGVLIRLSAFLTVDVTLVGLPRHGGSMTDTEALNLNRGLAILSEKGVEAAGFTASSLAPEALAAKLKAADLVVSAYDKDHHNHFHDVPGHDLQAVLIYIGSD
ncbi:MAG: hypothetical protein JEZ11_26050 [Desulfobacterales bacterium]|nr:hypothetical protein [Desulfobacterales bacterium]